MAPALRAGARTSMSRAIDDHCRNCKLAFVMGPLFWDYVAEVRGRGLRRTLGLDYQLYERWFGHEPAGDWPTVVSIDDCDSVYLGDVIDPDLSCPRCGEFAFGQRDDS